MSDSELAMVIRQWLADIALVTDYRCRTQMLRNNKR